MRPPVETDIRPDQCSRTDTDETGVDDDAVEVQEHPRSKAEISAVVDVYGWFYPGFFGEEGVVQDRVLGWRW